MEEALSAHLLSAASVTALVGGRVHWIDSKDETRPALRLQVIGGAEGTHLTGANGLFQGVVQVDCLGSSASSAIALGHAVVACLQGLGSGGFRGVWHRSTRHDRENGRTERARAYRVSLDFSVNWRQ